MIDEIVFYLQTRMCDIQKFLETFRKELDDGFQGLECGSVSAPDNGDEFMTSTFQSG